MTEDRELPLFPLNTVLFPGGPLGLRIFETRYLDMISDCLKEGRGFGVVTIDEGQEAGSAAATFHDLGTLAQIVDFDRLDDGLLGISCQGGQRFKVISHRVQDDQLIVARVETIADEPPAPISEHDRMLVRLLQKLMENDDVKAYYRWIKSDWVNAVWVGYRLTELLPLPKALKQGLLAMDDPAVRLDTLRSLLKIDPSI